MCAENIKAWEAMLLSVLAYKHDVIQSVAELLVNIP